MPLALLLLVLVGCVAPPHGFEVEEPIPLRSLDGGAWDAALRRFVHRGFLDYPELCREPALEDYLAQLERVDLAGASREEVLAFYINAYNATAVASVLGGGRPVGLLGRYGFFLRRRHRIAGESITLWDLEHERLRNWGEPRIHFAIVCASASCPALRAGLYRPDELDAQLEAATREFVADPVRNDLFEESPTLRVSAIFDWYREDFEAVASSVGAFIAGHVPDAVLAQRLREAGSELRFLDYDWTLNGLDPGDCE